MANRRRVGSEYENMAAAFLEGRGYVILERNFRSRTGEIDIVADDGGVLVFVEVKYRGSGAYGIPEEAVDVRKQQRICRAADYYRLANRVPDDRPCRFDIVAVQGEETRLIKNAFPYR